MTEKHLCAQTVEEHINSPQTKELTLVHRLTNPYTQPTAGCKLLINQKRRTSLGILAEISGAHRAAGLYYQQPTLQSHFLHC